MFTIRITDNTNGIIVEKEFYVADAEAIHEFVDMWCDLDEEEPEEEEESHAVYFYSEEEMRLANKYDDERGGYEF